MWLTMQGYRPIHTFNIGSSLYLIAFGYVRSFAIFSKNVCPRMSTNKNGQAQMAWPSAPIQLLKVT